jgi:23S rRNA pseudouridine955/2504/2580 synthase
MYRTKRIDILYEDDEIILINKPQGLAVQLGATLKVSVDTLLPEQLGYPVYLVHRLDKDTAGILIIAKTPQAANKWTKLVAGPQVKKTYNAICSGCPETTHGIIDECIMQKDVKKTARTEYSVLKTVKKEDGCVFSLVQFILDTGRMHQIRIHCAKKNFPILMDDKYGNYKINKQIKKQYGIKKMQLASIELSLPVKNKNTVFKIENPLNLEIFSNT